MIWDTRLRRENQMPPRRRMTTPRPKRRQRAIRHEDEDERELGGIEIGTSAIGDKAEAQAPQCARETDRRA
jgi:hypothetical protein